MNHSRNPAFLHRVPAGIVLIAGLVFQPCADLGALPHPAAIQAKRVSSHLAPHSAFEGTHGTSDNSTLAKNPDSPPEDNPGVPSARLKHQIAAIITTVLCRDIHLTEEDIEKISGIFNAQNHKPEEILQILREAQTTSGDAVELLFLDFFSPQDKDVRCIRALLQNAKLQSKDIEEILDLVSQAQPKARIFTPQSSEPVWIEIDPSSSSSYASKLAGVAMGETSLEWLDENFPRVIAMRSINNAGINLSNKKRLDYWVLSRPQQHLRLCQPRTRIEQPFGRLHPDTADLTYNTAHVVDPTDPLHPEYLSILAVSEIQRHTGSILRTWAVVDDKGRYIEIRHFKKSTLPAEYVSDDAIYNTLARFTYSFAEKPGCALGPKNNCVFIHEGHDWLDLPQPVEFSL